MRLSRIKEVAEQLRISDLPRTPSTYRQRRQRQATSTARLDKSAPARFVDRLKCPECRIPDLRYAPTQRRCGGNLIPLRRPPNTVGSIAYPPHLICNDYVHSASTVHPPATSGSAVSLATDRNGSTRSDPVSSRFHPILRILRWKPARAFARAPALCHGTLLNLDLFIVVCLPIFSPRLLLHPLVAKLLPL